MTRRRRKESCQTPDMDETKEHILAAGKEILLAAQGALRFCKCYVEHQSSAHARPHLVQFFQRAIAVADELSRGLVGIAPIKKVAEEVTKPLFDVMEREMRSEARHVRSRPKTKKPTRRKTSVKKKRTKTTRRRTRRV